MINGEDISGASHLFCETPWNRNGRGKLLIIYSLFG